MCPCLTKEGAGLLRELGKMDAWEVYEGFSHGAHKTECPTPSLLPTSGFFYWFRINPSLGSSQKSEERVKLSRKKSCQSRMWGFVNQPQCVRGPFAAPDVQKDQQDVKTLALWSELILPTVDSRAEEQMALIYPRKRDA